MAGPPNYAKNASSNTVLVATPYYDYTFPPGTYWEELTHLTPFIVNEVLSRVNDVSGLARATRVMMYNVEDKPSSDPYIT